MFLIQLGGDFRKETYNGIIKPRHPKIISETSQDR